MKNIAKGLVVLSFLALAIMATPAVAQNINANANAFLNARAELKADALIRLESALGVVLGPDGALRVMGAKVTSVSNGDVNATAAFGESALNFVVKTDSDTKINGRLGGSLAGLKAGDKISFSGKIVSSTSSSITVDASHVVSRSLFSSDLAEAKTSWKGEVQSVNSADSSFNLKLKNGLSVKVNVSSSTAITLDGAVATLASLEAGDEVKVSGELSADGSVITATKVSAESEDADEEGDEDEDDDEDEESDNSNRGGFIGKILNWFWK